MRIFLTGGSGYIGHAVLTALVAARHDVAALARSDESQATVTGLGATAMRGALTDVRVLREAASEADAVIHLGAAGEDTGVVDAAAAAALQDGVGAGTYVHTGGAWVFGSAGPDADEDAPLAPPPLTAWRVDVEAEVLGRVARGGRPVVVLPGVAYGEQGGLPQMLVELGRGQGVVRSIGDGAQHWGLVHLEDLADLYVRALDARAGARYIAVSESVRLADIAAALAAAPQNPDAVVPWSLEEARTQLGELADALALDQRLSSARARRELSWKPRHRSATAELATK